MTILYFGDHDPSGEDMVRDIRTRLERFGVGHMSAWKEKNFTVKKIGLTMDQIKKYQPPPNPTKMTDARAAAYVKKFGNKCWEVDALDPDVMEKIVQREIAIRRDQNLLDKVLDLEERQKAHWLKVIPAALKKNPGPMA